MRLESRRCYGFLVFFTVAISLVGCQTNPIKSGHNLSKMPLVGNLFSTPISELEKLTTAGELVAADAVYKENYAYFEEHKEKGDAALTALGSGIGKAFTDDFTQQIPILEALNNQWPLDRSLWIEYRSHFEEAFETYAALAEFKVLESGKYRSDQLNKFMSLYESATKKATADAADLLVTYGVTKEPSFFDVYPVKLAAVDEVMSAARPRLVEQLIKLPKAGMRSWVANYQLNEEQKDKFGWDVLYALTSGKDLKAILETAFIFDIETEKLYSELFYLIISTDSVLSSVHVEGADTYQRASRSTITDSLLKCGSKPVLLMHVHGVNVDREIVGQKTVQSRYVSTTLTIPNPEYQGAIQELQAAQNQYSTAQLRNTLTPCVGWGCLGQALGEVGQAAAVNNAKNKLSSVPPTIKENVYSDYSYQVTDISVTKRTPVSLFILDKDGNGSKVGSDVIQTTKTYHVAYGYRDNDHNEDDYLKIKYDKEEEVPSTNISQAELDLNELSPLLSGGESKAIAGHQMLLASIGEDQRSMGRIVNRPAKIVAPRSKSDLRIKSVVVIESAGSAGAGFFVKKGVVLTNNHVVGKSALAIVRDSAGNVDTGEVIARDIKRDLALIKTKLTGVSVTFDIDNVPVGGTVEAIGHPEGLNYSVSRGIIGALREKKSKYDTSGDPVLLIQTDAPINPGNSGGPLFLGKRVVGVNTWKISSEEIEGIGFAVHASEIKRFMLKHGY